jgi:DNA repair photolyase
MGKFYVQRVNFELKFNVFVGCHWGCSYEIEI